MNISNRIETEQQIIQDISFMNHSESERKKLDQFDVAYGRELQSPILGYRYQLPDLPTNHVPSTILDTSLLHIPVYTHLKVYDLKPVQLPEIPSILSALHLQFSEDTVLSKSSREISSTARISEEGRVSASRSVRDSTKRAHKK
ncbi:uncharacterized protein [Anoplolepis gracilipes]|uniref:uncharacterized protein n=1 Tax=Anoplolepis gracilipes TaxID=354296 RepID=UPI003B9F53C6